MTSAVRPSTLALFLGDILCFALAIWVSLFLRAFSVPEHQLLTAYALSFTPLFFVWVGVFFIAGLYERRQIILARRDLSASLLVAQTINVVIAALYFFFMPYFGITPKTVLVIYLIVSFVLTLLWRVALYPRLGLQRSACAIVVGEGEEIEQIISALGPARRSPVRIEAVVRPREEDIVSTIAKRIEQHRPAFIIADLSDARVSAALSGLYNLIARGIRFIDAPALYEEIFGRVPLSYVDDRWLARHISLSVHPFYDSLKRLMDVALSAALGLVSLVLYPFIVLAIKLDDSGPIFITQERVGQAQRLIYLYKFRSMQRNDMNLAVQASDNKITRVGRFLRSTRLDELPQLWNILRGDLSLIGPRPELPSGVTLYAKEIPYYNLRHLIKPGLSGWAQLYHDNHPHHAAAVEATREKLSYDLYYLKHRSLTLDGVIALKTIKKMLIKSGI